MANNSIIFSTNNNGTIKLKQANNDGCVDVCTSRGLDEIKTSIPAGDFVMLLNYYNYIKSNNIQCDFINPYGTNEK